MMNKFKKFYSSLFYFFLSISLFLICGLNWLSTNFGTISIDQIVFLLNVPMKGVSTTFFRDFLMECIVKPLSILFLFYFFTLNFFKTNLKFSIVVKKKEKIFLKYPFSYHEKLFLICSVFLLLGSLFYVNKNLSYTTYIENKNKKSTIFENYYVNPKDVSLNFPTKKRNLIYIFLESIENTYFSEEFGGAETENLMPELLDLAQNNISFSSSPKFKGPLESFGTTFTVGAMVAHTSGVPLKLPFNPYEYYSYDSFLPGAYSIGDILEKNGYNQTLMVGSDATFGNREKYFKDHGNYKIYDYKHAIIKRKIPKDYHVWWGFEDRKLYEFAKQEIIEMSKKDKPFNFTMLTVDTHHVGGYVCELCPKRPRIQFENVISCASKQVFDFVSWIKQQKFYENTTIVIVGDHNSMDPDYFKVMIDPAYDRTTFNVFINPAESAESKLKNRLFCKMDLFPTTLASLGVSFPGNRLGLGTNLFSDEKTLPELLGKEIFEEQLSLHSDFYDSKLLYGK